ncbi:hypothetical protein [Streptomyces incanus]|uniref:Transposase IS4-like domain-containing protein n=1 Tax=Streptomyces incanus TaxID=887453 RepID=A0ABW0Y4D1_9ACTN
MPQATCTPSSSCDVNRYIRELSFYRCHSAVPVALADLAHVICTRWKIEETFQNAKSITGLDQGQVAFWNSWMRWSLISLLAAAVLAVTRLRTTRATRESELPPGSPRELLNVLRTTALPPAPPGKGPRPKLIRLTPPPSSRRPSLPPPLEQHHRRRSHLTCTNKSMIKN